MTTENEQPIDNSEQQTVEELQNSLLELEIHHAEELLKLQEEHNAEILSLTNSMHEVLEAETSLSYAQGEKIEKLEEKIAILDAQIENLDEQVEILKDDDYSHPQEETALELEQRLNDEDNARWIEQARYEQEIAKLKEEHETAVNELLEDLAERENIDGPQGDGEWETKLATAHEQSRTELEEFRAELTSLLTSHEAEIEELQEAHTLTVKALQTELEELRIISPDPLERAPESETTALIHKLEAEKEIALRDLESFREQYDDLKLEMESRVTETIAEQRDSIERERAETYARIHESEDQREREIAEAVETAVTAHKAEVATLREFTTTQEAEFNERLDTLLGEKDTEHTTAVAKFYTEIESLQADVGNLRQELLSNAEEYEDLHLQLTDANGHVDSLKGEVDSMKAELLEKDEAVKEKLATAAELIAESKSLAERALSERNTAFERVEKVRELARVELAQSITEVERHTVDRIARAVEQEKANSAHEISELNTLIDDLHRGAREIAEAHSNELAELREENDFLRNGGTGDEPAMRIAKLESDLQSAYRFIGTLDAKLDERTAALAEVARLQSLLDENGVSYAPENES